MAKFGANKLKNAIKRLEGTNKIPTFRIVPQGKDLLRIEKLSQSSADEYEFAFLVRIDRSNGNESWWPIEYRSLEGEILACERNLNGKTLVNVSKQNQLIDLAETWASSLEAQSVVRSVDGLLN